jgi:hypothetical protein
LGWIAVSGPAAVGFAGIAMSRLRLAAEGRRAGNRLELVRSTVLALVMTLFAGAAAYGMVVRLVAMIAGRR